MGFTTHFEGPGCSNEVVRHYCLLFTTALAVIRAPRQLTVSGGRGPYPSRVSVSRPSPSHKLLLGANFGGPFLLLVKEVWLNP